MSDSESHRIVVEQSIATVSAVAPADLNRPTPCAGWDLAELLRHMVAQHRGFATALRGDGRDLSAWTLPETGAEALELHASTAAEVLAAFEDVEPEQPVWLPELTTEAPFAADRVRGFHLIDYVVHTWDVARAVGHDYDLDPRAEAAALRIAFEVPNTSARGTPGALFGRVVSVEPAATPLERILGYLGRDPGWQPPTA
jgi:uncharacterized protein (TIGR03086 family)